MENPPPQGAGMPISVEAPEWLGSKLLSFDHFCGGLSC